MAIKSLVQSGSKVWLDSVDPDEISRYAEQGVTGATSNPVIISGLIKSGRFDRHLEALMQDFNDEAVAWAMADYLVSKAQERFQEVWERTGGDDGWVSFELDPLLEDVERNMPNQERVKRYIELGKHWASGYTNRMIKVPATPAGIEALEPLAEAGVTLNVTLIFTERQYTAARDAIWRGAQRRENGLNRFKSVYSIFLSRLDVYTDKKLKDLSDDAQGMAGIVNAKRIWRLNSDFWEKKDVPLSQEMIFASTGAKLDWQGPDYYVEAMAGSDIMTNPPETNEHISKSDRRYERRVDEMPEEKVLRELDEKVDQEELERVLMEEGVEKFASPQKELLKAVKEKRQSLGTG